MRYFANNLKAQWKFIVILCTFLIAIYWMIPSAAEVRCKSFGYFVSLHIEGVIDSVFVDRHNHAELIAIIKNNNEFLRLNLSHDLNQSFYLLEKGTIISKDVGRNDMHLMSTGLDTTIVVDFGCRAAPY